MIQILVLQNYLVSRLLTILFITILFGQSAHLLSLRQFFGNAKSICSFVQTMFDEPQDLNDHHDLPPIPKHLIIDLSIVTGIDSSAGKVSSSMRVSRAHCSNSSSALDTQ